jgi:protein-tyrosine phosphatase
VNGVARTRVLFVCLGNICRSPTAHAVFESLLAQRGLSSVVEVDSCGTGDWHVGHPPDRRATVEAGKRGYDLTPLRARQVRPDDFRRFHYILAMDRMNLAELQDLCPDDFRGHLSLFLPFAGEGDIDEVPDPYYGGDEGFTRVLDLVERASEGLLREISRAHATR